MQLLNLIKVVQVLFLRSGCWHAIFEQCSTLSGNVPYSACINKCPYCRNDTRTFILPIRQEGLQAFLVHTYISSAHGIVSIAKLTQHLLKAYENVGKEVYGKRSVKPPDTRYLQSTVLQLIASQLIILKPITDESEKVVLGTHLNVNDDGIPLYNAPYYWTLFFTIP